MRARDDRYESAGTAGMVFVILVMMMTILAYTQRQNIKDLEQRIEKLEQSNADR